MNWSVGKFPPTEYNANGLGGINGLKGQKGNMHPGFDCCNNACLQFSFDGGKTSLTATILFRHELDQILS